MGLTRDKFEKALFCQPPECMGRQLQPFSLAHYLALQIIDSPFLYSNAAAPIGQLGAAVFLCSLPTAELFARLSKGQSLAVDVEHFGRLSGAGNHDINERIFRAYIADYTDLPEYWHKPGADDKGPRAPWEFHLIRILTSVYNCTLEQAWSMPLALARCYFDVEQECQGSEALMTDKEQADIAKLKASATNG